MAMDNQIREHAREAHMRFDKTRCAAWLMATGNRPVSNDGMVATGGLAKGPQSVRLAAVPRPEHGCDVHSVES